ncbi:MAG: DUF3825 domain-containing protein [Coriobacteriia bacterium]|nr:DUF3825 domain-containing protein [Coriobacteriia bacterium]MBS5477944.1 DUF3825 domain-containing protein [Coriobacteriia bacterium]
MVTQPASAVPPSPERPPEPVKACIPSAPETETPAIPLEEQQNVYRILASQFPFEQDIPMATVSHALNEAGVDRESFGFKKMKAFLAELTSFLSFTDIIANGVPQRLVTIHEQPGWAAPTTSAPETAKPRPSRPQASSPSKELERFAWLGSWNSFLSQLAAMALPESWDFDAPDERPSGQRPFAILKSFICTTFYRLKLEDKVLVNEEGTFAAFNTGLFDRRYDDIYACFEPSGAGESDELAPWKFAGLCTCGVRTLGKRLVSTFNPRPEPASYFASKDDLLYDLNRELIVDYDHILIDNIARLPIAYLRDELGEDPEMVALLSEAEAPDVAPERYAALLGQVGRSIQANPRLFRRLRWRLEDAVDVAKRRIRWNYKTAIPSYYPRANTMSLLLPLCLLEDGVADVALVVQLMPSGVYQGQTILTMRQAYMNARLICRPDSDWLTTVGRADSGEGEE